MRRFLFRFLRAKPEDIAGETYNAMVVRQDRERLSFQENCKHKKLSFRYSPLAICANCQKTLRYMTDEEMEEKQKTGLFEVNKELKEFGVRLESPPPMTEEELQEEDRIVAESRKEDEEMGKRGDIGAKPRRTN